MILPAFHVPLMSRARWTSGTATPLLSRLPVASRPRLVSSLRPVVLELMASRVAGLIRAVAAQRARIGNVAWATAIPCALDAAALALRRKVVQAVPLLSVAQGLITRSFGPRLGLSLTPRSVLKAALVKGSSPLLRPSCPYPLPSGPPRLLDLRSRGSRPLSTWSSTTIARISPPLPDPRHRSHHSRPRPLCVPAEHRAPLGILRRLSPPEVEPISPRATLAPILRLTFPNALPVRLASLRHLMPGRRRIGTMCLFGTAQ